MMRDMKSYFLPRK